MSEFEISTETTVHLRNEVTGELDRAPQYESNIAAIREKLEDGSYLYTIFNKATGATMFQAVRDA